MKKLNIKKSFVSIIIACIYICHSYFKVHFNILMMQLIGVPKLGEHQVDDSDLMAVVRACVLNVSPVGEGEDENFTAKA